MHPAIDDYLRGLSATGALAVAAHLEAEVPEHAPAVAVRFAGGRGLLALDPPRLYSLHEHPHGEQPPTLVVTHLGRLTGAVVEEIRRPAQEDGEGFAVAGVAVLHPSLPGGRVDAEGLMTRPDEAVAILRPLAD